MAVVVVVITVRDREQPRLVFVFVGILKHGGGGVILSRLEKSPAVRTPDYSKWI